MVEEFIKGKEIVVGVYRHNGHAVVLPITEINFDGDFHTYEMKLTNNETKRTPARLSEKAQKTVENAAKVIYEKLNCRGPARYDFIWQEDTEKLYYLELNDPPAIDDGSSFTAEVWASGTTMREFFGRVIDEAFYDGSNEKNLPMKQLNVDIEHRCSVKLNVRAVFQVVGNGGDQVAGGTSELFEFDKDTNPGT